MLLLPRNYCVDGPWPPKSATHGHLRLPVTVGSWASRDSDPGRAYGAAGAPTGHWYNHLAHNGLKATITWPERKGLLSNVTTCDRTCSNIMMLLCQ
jgi:hypothetical protein